MASVLVTAGVIALAGAVFALAAAPRDGRRALRRLLAGVYLAVGFAHLAAPAMLLPIMPPAVPFPRAVVLFTGVCEILGALGLLAPATRRWAGMGLAAYAVCVFPANLYHAFGHVNVPGLPSSWWYHAPRLAFQPVFCWWALFAGEALDWPFSPHRPAFALKAAGPRAQG